MNRAFELNKIDLDLKIDGFIDLEMVKLIEFNIQKLEFISNQFSQCSYLRNMFPSVHASLLVTGLALRTPVYF